VPAASDRRAARSVNQRRRPSALIHHAAGSTPHQYQSAASLSRARRRSFPMRTRSRRPAGTGVNASAMISSRIRFGISGTHRPLKHKKRIVARLRARPRRPPTPRATETPAVMTRGVIAAPSASRG
jgi:hypothetical protein